MTASGSIPRLDELPMEGAAVHLMGISGAGMRGLAVLLTGAGYRVSGCDQRPAQVEELSRLGIAVVEGHDAGHLSGVEALIYTAAVPEDQAELQAGRQRGIPILKRGRVLGALLNERRLVGITGTHGKTTITAMTGLACIAAGLDPTVAVGGRVPELQGFARSGASEVAIVEADEFDQSFLQLDPSLAVISSVEAEHLESYGTMSALEEAYLEFGRRAANRDGVLVCADDPGAAAVGRRIPGSLTYGLSSAADYQVSVVERTASHTRCRLRAPSGRVDFGLRVTGEHNVQNAAAALAVPLRFGVDPSRLTDALASFGGVERRLERITVRGGVTLVDDYAHHPTEVIASLRSLRESRSGDRLVVVFQPHLFSRTQAFARQFGAALGDADEALVLPVYPAREAPIPGVTSELIADAGGADVRTGTADEALELVAGAAEQGPTTIVFMGAGDVTELARRAARRLMEDAVGA